MPTITSPDGTTIAYERAGDGPLLLVVGGALASADSFAGLARRCGAFATVVRYDRRGRGASTDRSPHRVADEVDDLRSLCAEVGRPALCYGHSSGGLLALKAAAAGVTMDRLVCYEPPFLSGDRRSRMPADLSGQLATLAASGRGEDAVRAFLGAGTGMAQEEIEARRARPSWPAMVALAPTLAYDVALCRGEEAVRPDEVAAVRQPTLVLVGGATSGTLLEAAEDLVTHLPDGRQSVLAGQRHVVESAVIAPVLRAELAAAGHEPIR